MIREKIPGIFIIVFIFLSAVLSAQEISSRTIFQDQWGKGWNHVFSLNEDSVLLLVNTRTGVSQVRRSRFEQEYSLLRTTENVSSLELLEHMTYFSRYNLFYFFSQSDQYEGTGHFFPDTGTLKVLHKTMSQRIWSHAEPFHYNGQFMLLYNSGVSNTAFRSILNPRLGLYETVNTLHPLPQGLDDFYFYEQDGELFLAALDIEKQKSFCFKVDYRNNSFDIEVLQTQDNTDKFSLLKGFSLGKRDFVLFYSRSSGITEIFERKTGRGGKSTLVSSGRFSWVLNADNISFVPSPEGSVRAMMLSSHTGLVKVYELTLE